MKVNMKMSSSRWPFSWLGMSWALGITWHIDSGFWSILTNTLLGWIYVAYKLTQYVVGMSGLWIA